MAALLRVGDGRSGGQARGRSTTSTPKNYTSIVTVARAGAAPRAGKKRHHRSARAGGVTAVSTTLRLALAARDKELRVERARSDNLAATRHYLERAEACSGVLRRGEACEHRAAAGRIQRRVGFGR